MVTDGGGWTMVSSTTGNTVNDQGQGYSGNLQTLYPTTGMAGVWNRMRSYFPTGGDTRFSCKRNRAATSFDVDLVFYDVSW